MTDYPIPDEFSSPRPQPSNRVQRTARSNYSTLLIFGRDR